MKNRDAPSATSNEKETRDGGKRHCAWTAQNAAVAEVSNGKERRATERKIDARRKGRWPRVRGCCSPQIERRTLQAEEGGCELGGIHTAEGVLLAPPGGSEEKKVWQLVMWQLVMWQLWLTRRFFSIRIAWPPH